MKTRISGLWHAGYHRRSHAHARLCGNAEIAMAAFAKSWRREWAARADA